MSKAAPAQDKVSPPRAKTGVGRAGLAVQRKCACGSQSSSLSGQCEDCKKKLQTKLTVGATNDPLEQEADRIATLVVSGSAQSSQRRSPLHIQRFSNRSTEGAEHAPPSVDRALSDAGSALQPGLLTDMSQRFGHDFSRVRVHTGAAADRSAQQLNANAYTVGHDIVFGRGQFNPSSGAGRLLLAHELTHVVQQTASANAGEGLVQRDTGDAGAPPPTTTAPELTEKDATTCSPLYQQKLCVHIIGGFNGDRSGVETPEEMAGYNSRCRAESGYDGPDVSLSLDERAALRNPRCPRGDSAAAKSRARDERIGRALKRSAAYGQLSEELVRAISDPVFLIGLSVGITGYLALWVVPEPVVTKLAAALTTIAILSTGAFSISVIVNLASAWSDLEREAGDATTDAEIEAAAQKFGKRITATEADLLVFLASLLVGGKLPGPKRLPPAATALADAQTALNGAKGGVVIEGPWGRIRNVPSEPGVPATQGATALKVEPATKPMQLPEVAPANDNALPLPANDNAVPLPKAAAPKAQSTKVTVAPGPTGMVKPAPAKEPKESKCRDSKEPTTGALPIKWPWALPLPGSGRALMRTPSGDHNLPPEARSAPQRMLQGQIKLAREHNVPPPMLCIQKEVLENAPYDAHHRHPLFIGGAEDEVNLCSLRTDFHQDGHPALYNQRDMLADSVWMAYRMCEGDMRRHPAGQKYVIQDRKKP